MKTPVYKPLLELLVAAATVLLCSASGAAAEATYIE